MSAKVVAKTVDTKPEAGEINTALLSPSGEENSKNGSHGPASTAISVEVVDSDATRDNISSKSKKLVHVKERVSEELSNNTKTRKCCTWFLHLVGVSIPYIAILVGALHLDECPSSPLIPIHLIVAGTVAALIHISTSIDMFRGLSYLKRDEVQKPAILTLISIFMLVWMILGCVWTYGLYPYTPEIYDRWSPFGRGYCNYHLYWFAFWFNTITLVSWLLAWIICCCVCSFLCNLSILTCLCLTTKENSDSEQEAAAAAPTKV